MSRLQIDQTVTSGWPSVRLANAELELTVVPGKGADITSMRDLASGHELLWSTRWGLRPPTALPQPGSPEALALDRSGGGWHTLFPNAGKACVENNVDWGFHGEAWLAPFEWTAEADGLTLTSIMARSPFTVTKRIAVDGPKVSVTETVTHVGAQPVDVLWCQHPTFGAPLIGRETTVDITACRVHPDMPDDVPSTAEPPAWPTHRPVDGPEVDLSRLTEPRHDSSRLAFLGDFVEPQVTATVRNPELGLGVDVCWSTDDFPYAWYWYEAGGRHAHPWYGAAHGMSIEPATGYPSGLHRARSLTGTQTSIEPDETISKTVSVEVHRNR